MASYLHPVYPTRRSVLAGGGATFVAWSLPLRAQSGGAPVVETAAGPVRGENFGPVNRFLGIPYAQSISGANRFAPPQPVVPWTEPRYVDSAPQQAADLTGGTPVTPTFDPPAYVQAGDDCLALHVWAPDGADGSLPVMVWLHGGGWTSGSGSCAIYDGENLARRGDVLVVTISLPSNVPLGPVAGMGVGLFFVAPWIWMTNFVDGRSSRLVLIDGGFATIATSIMGALLDAF